jgi:hypothetical protein
MKISVLCLALIIPASLLCSCTEEPVQPDLGPPSVEIVFPADGDSVMTQVPVVVEAEDDVEVLKVQFFVDDMLIAEDISAPFDQVWYAGYWPAGREYTLSAVASDISGNVSRPDTVLVYALEGGGFVPVLTAPEDGVEMRGYPGSVEYSWNPVPGARGYIFRIESDGLEWNEYYCIDAEQYACYTHVYDTVFTGPLMLYRAPPIDWEADFTWSVCAFWSMNYVSGWSEEQTVHLYGYPSPGQRDLLKGVRIEICEECDTYRTSYVEHEPQIRVLMETVVDFPNSNLDIDCRLAVYGDVVELELLWISTPETVEYAYGPAHANVPLDLSPGDYTVRFRCFDMEDEVALTVTDTLLQYIPLGDAFIRAEETLRWRIRPQSFFYHCWFQGADEWYCGAFADSLAAVGLFEEFEYPAEGLPPYPYAGRYFRYSSEEDYILVGEALRTYIETVLPPGYCSFRLVNWRNITYNCYRLP